MIKALCCYSWKKRSILDLIWTLPWIYYSWPAIFFLCRSYTPCFFVFCASAAERSMWVVWQSLAFDWIRLSLQGPGWGTWLAEHPQRLNIRSSSHCTALSRRCCCTSGTLGVTVCPLSNGFLLFLRSLFFVGRDVLRQWGSKSVKITESVRSVPLTVPCLLKPDLLIYHMLVTFIRNLNVIWILWEY